MLAELGYLSLLLATGLALLQGTLPWLGLRLASRPLLGCATPLALLVAILLGAALLLLASCFGLDDFTLVYVAQHANSALPMGFKLAAVPLNGSFRYGAPELAGVLADSSPAAILFDPDMNEGLGGYVPNMLAENVTNLPGGFDYYLNQTLGASDSFIRVFCMGEYGQIMDGKPVYGNYNDRIHRASAPLFKSKQIPLIIGMDWGLQPAAAITQMSPRGQLAVLRELAPTDVTFDDFLNEWLVPCLKGEFGGYPVQVIGDPAGTARSALSSKTVYEVLRSRGIAAEPAISNDFNLRRDSVDYFLKRNGGFIVDPSCTVIIEGFQGAYRYSKVTIKNARAVPRPEKNYASHPHDALQYAASYYYQQVLKRIRPGRNKPQPAKKRYLYA